MRASTPVFTLSWLVVHRIDAQSLLAGLTAAMFADDEMMIVASITGHDTTYGQTVHDRHVYQSDVLRWGHRFVDVITRHGGNRVEIDFGQFDETVPDPLSVP